MTNIIMNEERIEGQGGLNLFVRSWRPEGESRGVVVIVPGFNSHSAYYAWVGEQLAAHGLAAYAVDLRGRGQSDGERFFVESFDDWANDAGTAIMLAKSQNPGLPVYLLGHSAGGVAASVYALDHQAELAGLISESIAFQVPAPAFALAVLKGLSHIFPHAHVLHLPNENFSRDAGAVEIMNNDPLIGHETQPTQTVAAMARADERLKKEFSSITLPLLILHGTGDKVTRFEGSQFLYDTAGSADKTIKLYEGHFHDLLNDIDKEQVIADIKNWIDERIAVAKAAAEG